MKKIILNTVQKNSPNYKKYYALIDDEDYERVNKHNWSIQERPHTIYAASMINGKLIRLHIFIIGFKWIDHTDGDGLNCQKSNLRKATRQQNGMNRKSNKIFSSQYKGVHWHKRIGKWQSQIVYNGKHIHLSYFDSEIEAAKKYNEKAKELFGEFAKLNMV